MAVGKKKKMTSFFLALMLAIYNLPVLSATESAQETPVNLLATDMDTHFDGGISPFTVGTGGGSQQIIQINGNNALELRDASNGSSAGTNFTFRLTGGMLFNRINEIYKQPVGTAPVYFIFEFKLERRAASSKPISVKSSIQFGNSDNILIPRYPTGEPAISGTAAYLNDEPDGSEVLQLVNDKDVAGYRFKVFPNGGQRTITSIDLINSIRVDIGGTDEAIAVDDLAVYEVQASPVTDTAAPTAPTNLTSPGKSDTSANLSWSASTDDVEVTGYNIYRDGLLCGAVNGITTNYTAIGLVPNTAYPFTVKARDAAGNLSAASNAVTVTTNPSASGLPVNFGNRDIGNVGLTGSASYNQNTGTFSVKGSGSDISGKEDAFHYVYQPWKGNGQIVARVANVEKIDNWTKAGVMIRESMWKQSPYAMMAVTPANGVYYQDRLQLNGDSRSIAGARASAPYWVKLARQDNLISAYESADGVTWNLVKEQEIILPETIYFGLAVTSHNITKLASADFDQVSVGQVIALEKVLVDNVELTDPTKLYVMDSGPASVPTVKVALRNKHSYDITGNVKLSILSRGTETVWESTYSYNARVNEVKQLDIPTTALTQGDYYVLNVQVLDQDGTVAGQRDLKFGVLHPPHEGVREQSPFGLNLRLDNKPTAMEIGKRIGMKWIREIGFIDPTIVNPQPGVYWTEADINKARQEVADWRQYGISSLGYVNYNMGWNVMPGPNGEQLLRHQNRPKDMAAHVEMVYRLISPLQDLIKNWEIWNEPWIHGWTWKTGTAQDYRDMTRMIWERVKPEFPDIKLIGGGSTSYSRDILYGKGSQDTGYLDGSVNHAYGAPDPAQLGYVKLQKYMDQHGSRGQGSGGMWQTELGTAEMYFPELPDAQKKYQTARTVAPTYLLNMLGAGETPIHIFWFELKYGLVSAYNMYDRNEPKPVVIAYSAMTHFLEDSKLVEELFPQEKSTWSFLFKREDGKATAALYSDRDYTGTVTLNGAQGIRVYDYLGKMVADGSQDTVTVTLNPWETNYIVSDLTPEELKQRLKAAKFDYTNPLVIRPLLLTEPVNAKSTKIEVQVENTTSNTISGQLNIQAPEGWELSRNAEQVEQLQPGEKRILAFPAIKTAASGINRYYIPYSFDIYGPTRQVVRSQQGGQTIQVAYAPKKTIAVDGNLSDWNDVLPVTMISNASKDYLAAALDPSKAKEILDNPGSFDNVAYTVRTAWDDGSFYFEAEVPDETQASNKTFAQDPYAFPFNADSVQLLFDTLKNNPDDLLAGDPHYDKALASHMDVMFAGTLAQGGVPELHRLVAPGTNMQTYYPTNAGLTPPLGPMDVTEAGGTEGRMKVVRDDVNKKTMYEIAVSWDAIPGLKEKVAELGVKQVHEGNFAFEVNDAGIKGKGASTWTKETGQLESGSYAFAPLWGSGQKDRGGSLVPRWGFKNDVSSYAFDNTPPELTVEGIAEGGSYEEQVIPAVSAADGQSGVESLEVTVDGISWVSGTPVTGKGAHILAAKAIDRAGNETMKEVHFSITQGTKLQVLPAAGVYSDSTTLQAVLTDLAGIPIGGETVTFQVYGGQPIGTAVTDGSGTARLGYTIQLGASAEQDTANVPIQAVYAGNGSSFYRASSADNVLAMSKEEASVRYTGGTFAAEGSGITLGAQVVQHEDGEPGGVGGLPVMLNVYGINADGTTRTVSDTVYGTDLSGTVQTVGTLPAGLYEVKAKLLPNPYFKTAETSVTVAVYKAAPSYLGADGFVTSAVTDGASGVKVDKVVLESELRMDPSGTVQGDLNLSAESRGLYLEMNAFEWLVVAGGNAYVQGIAYTPQGEVYKVRVMLQDSGKSGMATSGGKTNMIASVIVWKNGGPPAPPVLQVLGGVFTGSIKINP